MEELNIIKQAAIAAEERKAYKLVLLDLEQKNDLCRYTLICSGTNEQQTRAIASSIEERCAKMFGVKPMAIEGSQLGHWILIDYGFFMAHIFFQHIREFYALDQLWSGAKKINWLDQ